MPSSAQGCLSKRRPCLDKAVTMTGLAQTLLVQNVGQTRLLFVKLCLSYMASKKNKCARPRIWLWHIQPSFWLDNVLFLKIIFYAGLSVWHISKLSFYFFWCRILQEFARACFSWTKQCSLIWYISANARLTVHNLHLSPCHQHILKTAQDVEEDVGQQTAEPLRFWYLTHLE